jgi:hypothetical protein
MFAGTGVAIMRVKIIVSEGLHEFKIYWVNIIW